MINIKRLHLVFLLLTFFSVKLSLFAQKINQFDANNKRTGVWKKYYPNKQLRYIGEFKNGKEVGIFKFYRESYPKYPSIIKRYNQQNDSIKVEFYTINGKLQTKGVFIGKTRVGKWFYYFKNGKIMSEENYKDGKLHGELINLYPNGKITEITEYKNGIKEGISRKYSSDGILIEEITYRNNKPNGLAKFFELNGNLKERGVYKDGKRVGKWEFFLDGEVADKKELEKKKKYTKKKN